VKDATEFSEK